MSVVTTHEKRIAAPAVSGIKRVRKWLGGSFSPYLFVAPFFLFFAAFSVYPLLYALRLSFSYWHGDGDPRFIGLSNYTFLLSDTFFWQSLGNSLILELLIVPAQVVFALVIAALLAKKTLRFRWFFRTTFMTSFVVPLVALALVWRVLFDQDAGTVNTFLQMLHIPHIGWLTTETWGKPTLALLVLWKGSGFAILLMLAAIQGVPVEYQEAAALDGANAFQRFWYITIPHLRRTISFLVVVSTLGVIQMFVEPDILTKGGPYNSTTTAGYHLISYINNADFGTGAANSILLMILMVTISFLMLRLLRSGEES